MLFVFLAFSASPSLSLRLRFLLFHHSHQELEPCIFGRILIFATFCASSFYTLVVSRPIWPFDRLFCKHDMHKSPNCSDMLRFFCLSTRPTNSLPGAWLQETEKQCPTRLEQKESCFSCLHYSLVPNVALRHAILRKLHARIEKYHGFASHVLRIHMRNT